MKLTVKNFGPIREAQNIDISPMTIFVGPSNTGKSYLAMLLYSIFEVFADKEHTWKLSMLVRRERQNHLEIFNNLRKSQVSASTEIDVCFSKWAQIISNAWEHKIVYCLGEEGRVLLDGKNSDAGFSTRISDSENQLVLDLTNPRNSKITLQKKRQLTRQINQRFAELLSYEVKGDSGEEISSLPDEIYEDFARRYYPEVLLQHFQSTLLPWKQLEAPIDAYYLPAIRGGIMQSHRTLVSVLIKRAPMAGLSNLPLVPPFNGVLSDFMTKLINIENGEYKRTRSRLSGLGTRHRRNMRRDNYSDTQEAIDDANTRIERHILSGVIDVQRSETQYPDFRYKFTKDNQHYDLPLMNASSAVSEVAPVSLFLRHYVHPGDLFILEEPEAHLHPAAQRDISDVLARLVNARVNVLITTHSDNILEQVGNFIYASDVSESDLTRLDEAKCSVYFFKPSRSGKQTTVKKIPFDPETGLLTKDHLDVSSALYNETIDLMERRENEGSQTDIL